MIHSSNCWLPSHTARGVAAQVTWFNHLLKTLWPHMGKTIVKEVMAQAKPALIDVCNQASARRCHTFPASAANTMPGADCSVRRMLDGTS
jgi:hypothetical protein